MENQIPSPKIDSTQPNASQSIENEAAKTSANTPDAVEVTKFTAKGCWGCFGCLWDLVLTFGMIALFLCIYLF